MYASSKLSDRLAAGVFIGIAMGVTSVGDLNYTKNISLAVSPCLSVYWSRDIIASIGSRRINNFTGRLRSSKIDLSLYRKILAAHELNDMGGAQVSGRGLENGEYYRPV